MNLLRSAKKQTANSGNRYEKLDLIRGITLISMITYHTCWDLVWLYGKPWAWYERTPGYLWQQSICWTFILLSGLCWSMGRRKAKRGLQVLLSSCLVTLVTLLAMPEDPVYFGVLTFMGSAMLLLIPLEKILPKAPAAGLIMSGVLFFLLRNVNRGTFGFEHISFGHIPLRLYDNWFSTWLGFPFPHFYSSDYFSVLPWFSLFLAGYYLYQLMRKHDVLDHFKFRVDPVKERVWWRYPTAVIRWCGAHTLILYLLHQVVIYIVLLLIFT